MKLKKEFITYNADGESLLVPAGGTEFSGLVKGNKTLGVILEYLKEDRSVDEIVSLMTERFDASEETIRKDVNTAIEKLKSIGAIDE